MIKQVSHNAMTAGDPAGLTLALTVATQLHPPVTTRAPEVAASAGRAQARRNATARTHRRTSARG
ncbi:hypothetical protein ACWD4G_42130 [Streptomyces sp. NPDC002643]